MKILFIIPLFVILIFGKTIDKIVMIVNEIPITSYDIEKTIKIVGDKEKAIEILISDALIKAEIKKRGIYIDNFDIESKMEEIAKNNNMSLFQFKNYLLENGKFEEFKEKIQKQLEIEKLLSPADLRVSENDIKDYYKTHKKEFKIFQVIKGISYSSTNKQLLLEIRKNPMFSNLDVKSEDVVLESNSTNPKLMEILSKIPNSQFSPILPFPKEYKMFFISEKSGESYLPLKLVSGKIFQKLLTEKKELAFKNLKERLKSKAKIREIGK